MSDTKPETEATEKPQPKTDADTADTADAAWSEEMLEWAIASSTCGGLPRKKEDEAVDAADKDAKDNGDKPACP